MSWDKSLCIGATYDATDPSITHHIIDRPRVDKQVVGRWVRWGDPAQNSHPRAVPQAPEPEVGPLCLAQVLPAAPVGF